MKTIGAKRSPVENVGYLAVLRFCESNTTDRSDEYGEGWNAAMRHVREQAALICAIAASTPGWSITVVAPEIGATGRAQTIALRARWFARDEIGACSYEDSSREAEALLRTGWTPPGWR